MEKEKEEMKKVWVLGAQESGYGFHLCGDRVCSLEECDGKGYRFCGKTGGANQ